VLLLLIGGELKGVAEGDAKFKIDIMWKGKVGEVTAEADSDPGYC
jgi:hypothetical protein